MKRSDFVTLAALSTLSLGLTAGCGQTIQLKDPTRFTVKKVRLIQWHDRCGLQSYFNGNPPRSLQVQEVTQVSRTVAGRVQEVGQITKQIVAPKALRWFRRLLEQYYQGHPALSPLWDIQVTVDYYRYCGKPRMTVGSTITLRSGGRTMELAYHPCVGEFLLNRDIYATRHLHVDTAVAGKQRYQKPSLDAAPADASKQKASPVGDSSL